MPSTARQSCRKQEIKKRRMRNARSSRNCWLATEDSFPITSSQLTDFRCQSIRSKAKTSVHFWKMWTLIWYPRRNIRRRNWARKTRLWRRSSSKQRSTEPNQPLPMTACGKECHNEWSSTNFIRTWWPTHMKTIWSNSWTAALASLSSIRASSANEILHKLTASSATQAASPTIKMNVQIQTT